MQVELLGREFQAFRRREAAVVGRAQGDFDVGGIVVVGCDQVTVRDPGEDLQRVRVAVFGPVGQWRMRVLQ